MDVREKGGKKHYFSAVNDFQARSIFNSPYVWRRGFLLSS